MEVAWHEVAARARWPLGSELGPDQAWCLGIALPLPAWGAERLKWGWPTAPAFCPLGRTGQEGRSGEKWRSHLLLSLSPSCLQTATPWAPCPRCLRACPPVTTTHPRTATSPGTMTCLQYGTLRHPHFGARTADGPGCHAEAPHLSLLPRAGDRAGCALPGAGGGPAGREHGHSSQRK